MLLTQLSKKELTKNATPFYWTKSGEGDSIIKEQTKTVQPHKIFNHKQQLAKKDKYIISYHSITSSRRTSIQ